MVRVKENWPKNNLQFHKRNRSTHWRKSMLILRLRLKHWDCHLEKMPMLTIILNKGQIQLQHIIKGRLTDTHPMALDFDRCDLRLFKIILKNQREKVGFNLIQVQWIQITTQWSLKSNKTRASLNQLNNCLVEHRQLVKLGIECFVQVQIWIPKY